MNNIRVLLVEDDEVDRMLVERALPQYQVVTADCAAAAMQFLQGGEVFDCILLDYFLPGHNGMWVLSQMTEQLTSPPPVILLTGHENPELVAEAMKAGASDYLSKGSLTPDNLERAIRAAVNARRHKAALAELVRLESEARRQAEQANRIKDEFLAVVSHELRTPLSAILGWAQMLRSGSLGQDKIDSALEIIERNARAQSKLIEDLLDVSRILSGKLTLNIERVDLTSLIVQAIQTVGPAAEAKSVTLLERLQPAPEICGDATRLQQVFLNLLGNAVKFTPRGGVIEISLQFRDSGVQIEVTDSGEGISEEFLPYVFQPFRQAEGGTARKAGGLGLGLAIVRHLVEQHGGAVGVSSAGPGQGSTFSVRLPLASPLSSLERRPAGATAGCPPDLLGLRIVVVDDEPDNSELVRTLLVGCGAEVQVAGSADEAYNLIASWRPHALVSDLGMPQQDGYSLIRRVRALPADQGGQVAAVALSAYARPQDRALALESGFDHHCAKPIEAPELLTVLAQLAQIKV